MKKLLLGVLLVASSYSFSQAQSNLSEYEAQYQKALLFYQNNDFEKARIAFSQLSNLRFNNPIVPYSYYFQALAAIKVGKYAEAEASLQNLQLRYPNWEKNEEVAYLYATIAFENKDYAKGLQIANAITSDSLKNDILDLKKNFLADITDPKKLTSLSEQFPDEILLKERIQAKSSEMSSTKDLQQYRLNKGFLNFAFLLPVNIDELSPDHPRRANQYVFDMYQGAKLAKAQLQKEKINVNLQVYDISNDGDQMLEVLNNAYFQTTDLLVGPLYSESNKLANAFCESYQIPLINPISNNEKLLEIFDKSFLAQPSVKMQAIKAAEYVTKQAFLGRNAAIYYTSSSTDSLLAEAYKQVLVKKGYDIEAFVKVTANSEMIASKIPDKKLSHVFLATSDKKAGLAMLTALQKDLSTPLVTTAEAFQSSNLSGTTVAGREIYCIDPEFIDNENPEVDKFKKEYFAKYGSIPSYYSFCGYDMTLFWGRVLSKYGINFKKGLDDLDTYKQSFSTSGYDYTQSQDNQVVPITTFQNYKFVLAK